VPAPKARWAGRTSGTLGNNKQFPKSILRPLYIDILRMGMGPGNSHSARRQLRRMGTALLLQLARGHAVATALVQTLPTDTTCPNICTTTKVVIESSTCVAV